ncbi:MAG TPA: tripartite tricarboxylate transporter TctB family protein [Pseudolabrys sp.]|nr:tripartite tricarboxylate transporter TctB family protein [Pseudolabrys sp.]
MSDHAQETGGTGPSHRNVEIGVTLAIILIALIGIYGSMKVGFGWGAEGPQAGFFPFYVSVIVIISSVINLMNVVVADGGSLFARWNQLRQVGAVVLPTAIYVLAIPYIGIYVSSALLIAAFMIWFGRYGVAMAAAVAVVVPVLTFFMFEIWFLVPLPKGPLENFLGY